MLVEGAVLWNTVYFWHQPVLVRLSLVFSLLLLASTNKTEFLMNTNTC